jgi:hypothetical protein
MMMPLPPPPPAGPAGGGGPAGPPPAVVTNLTNVQATDSVTGLLVLGPTANNVSLGGVTVLLAGALTIILQAGPPNEQNGGPVIGNQYDITSTQGVFNNVQFLNNTPFLYRFG